MAGDECKDLLKSDFLIAIGVNLAKSWCDSRHGLNFLWRQCPVLIRIRLRKISL